MALGIQREAAMPIIRSWSTFIETVVNYERDEPGIYEFGDAGGDVIYTGSTNAIRRHLKEHLDQPSSNCIKEHATKYRVEYTPNYKAREQELYDEYVKTHGRPPICNEARTPGLIDNFLPC